MHSNGDSDRFGMIEFTQLGHLSEGNIEYTQLSLNFSIVCHLLPSSTIDEKFLFLLKSCAKVEEAAHLH